MNGGGLSPSRGPGGALPRHCQRTAGPAGGGGCHDRAGRAV